MSEASIKKEPVVYVVDDDLPTCRAVAELVHTFGHRVRMFESPKEFLESVDEKCPGCVVLDFRLPGLDGLEVHQRLLHPRLDALYVCCGLCHCSPQVW